MFKPFQAALFRKAPVTNASSASMALRLLKGEDPHSKELPESQTDVVVASAKPKTLRKDGLKRDVRATQKAVLVVNGNKHSEDTTTKGSTKVTVPLSAIPESEQQKDKSPSPNIEVKSKTAAALKTVDQKTSADSTRPDSQESLVAFKRFARSQKISVAWDKAAEDFAQPHTNQMHRAWIGGLQHQAQSEQPLVAKLKAEIARKDKEIAQHMKTIEQMTSGTLSLSPSADLPVIISNLTVATRRLAASLDKVQPGNALAVSAHQYLVQAGLLV